MAKKAITSSQGPIFPLLASAICICASVCPWSVCSGSLVLADTPHYPSYDQPKDASLRRVVVYRHCEICGTRFYHEHTVKATPHA